LIAGRQAWGLVGLYDRPRSGRPAIFTAEEQQKVYEYLNDSPKDVKKVVEAMEQKTQKRVSTKTIKRFIKKSHIWKRIKKVPAKSPEPQQYSSPFAQSTPHILNFKLPVEISPQPQPLHDGFLHP
jgi:hypothetical protein